MTDYTRSTGSSGEMMIRDTGTYVEFWLRAGSSTFMHELPWGYTINGVTDNANSYDFASGGSWQRLGRWNVTTDTTATFRLFDTGTSGLGGPTTLTASIERSGPPPAPTTPVLDLIDKDSIRANTNSNGNGGLAVDLIQIGYSTGSSTPTTIRTADIDNGIYTATGLAAGTRYYFWARMHNAKGYSPWSGRSTAITWDVPPAPTSPSATAIGQSSASFRFSTNGTGGGTGQPSNTGYELGYGTSSVAPTTIIAADGIDTINGLTPGTTYYIWARSKNSVGNSPWSARASFKTLAGARILVGGVWKTAVPYVRVAGVWKPATPYVKIGGLWKGTG